MTTPNKLNAVKKVFPDLRRPAALTNEQASERIEAETGIKVAPGYLKHIFGGRLEKKKKNKGRDYRPTPLPGHEPEPAADMRQHNAIMSSLNPAESIKETIALAKKVGGLNGLKELVTVLIEMGVTEDLKT